MSSFLLSVWVCILPCHQRLFKLQSLALTSHIQLLLTGYFLLDVKNFLWGHGQGLLSNNRSMLPLNPLICLLWCAVPLVVFTTVPLICVSFPIWCSPACSNCQRCFWCYFSILRFSSGILGSMEEAVNLTLMYYHLIKLMLLMWIVAHLHTQLTH